MTSILDSLHAYIAKYYDPDYTNKSLVIQEYFKKLFLFLHNNNLDENTKALLEDLLDEKYIDFKDGYKVHNLRLYFIIPEIVRNHFAEEYPKFLHNDGKMYPLFTGDIDKLCEEYCKKIGYNLSTHKKVMELLKYGKDHNLIKCGFEKFVKSYYWKTIEAYKGNGLDLINTEMEIDL